MCLDLFSEKAPCCSILVKWALDSALDYKHSPCFLGPSSKIGSWLVNTVSWRQSGRRTRHSGYRTPDVSRKLRETRETEGARPERENSMSKQECCIALQAYRTLHHNTHQAFDDTKVEV